MGSTLEHGIYLPSEGEKNCYQGLAGNWNKVDGALGDIAELKQSIESKFTKEIVTELPTEDINPFCIYMILKTDPETDNIYDEWVYINNNWEYLGNTKVDMTQYYTKQEVNQLPAVASGVTATKVGNYDAHIANGDIHVTASDKAKWDTVALIKQLRLVNAQVGSATTIAFANIDDTNGIKVGDKCMDLDGRMFEITAVDTTNQTVTVGTALIDLALDANVVHTSGNETVGGQKTFSSDTTIYNSTASVQADTPNLLFKNPLVERASTTLEGEQTILFTDKNDNNIGSIQAKTYTSGMSDIILTSYSETSDQSVRTTGIVIRRTPTTSKFHGYSDNITTLGDTNRRWKSVYAINYYYGSDNTEFSTKFVTTDTNQTISGNKTFSSINGVEPSSLSLPSGNANDVIDISSYITDFSGNVNSYTVPANGWISIAVVGTAIAIVSSSWSDSRLRASSGNVRMLYPVLKNQTLGISVTGTTLAYARFIPCQGNV